VTGPEPSPHLPAHSPAPAPRPGTCMPGPPPRRDVVLVVGVALVRGRYTAPSPVWLQYLADEDQGLHGLDQGGRPAEAGADLAQDLPALQLGGGPLAGAALTGMRGVDLFLVLRQSVAGSGRCPGRGGDAAAVPAPSGRRPGSRCRPVGTWAMSTASRMPCARRRRCRGGRRAGSGRPRSTGPPGRRGPAR